MEIFSLLARVNGNDETCWSEQVELTISLAVPLSQLSQGRPTCCSDWVPVTFGAEGSLSPAALTGCERASGCAWLLSSLLEQWLLWLLRSGSVGALTTLPFLMVEPTLGHNSSSSLSFCSHHARANPPGDGPLEEPTLAGSIERWKNDDL